MYKIGQKVIDKQTNEVCTVTQICDIFCLVMYKDGITVDRFHWELEECNLIQRILKKVGKKNGRE